MAFMIASVASAGMWFASGNQGEEDHGDCQPPPAERAGLAEAQGNVAKEVDGKTPAERECRHPVQRVAGVPERSSSGPARPSTIPATIGK